jgi:hypothetical protein
MRTLKIMSIISLVITAIGFLCMISFCNEYDYEAGIGWGMIVALYTIAFSIVVLVKSYSK